MGIWAAWLPVGAITMFLAAPSLALRWNWQGVWWFGCLFAAVGWILFFLFVKPPPGSGVPTSASPTHHRFTVRDLTSALGNPDLWLISLAFFCFTFCVNAFSTWLPSFLYLSHGIALDKSSHLTATLPLLFMFMAPLGGWLSDRTGFRKTMCLVPMCLSAVAVSPCRPGRRRAYSAPSYHVRLSPGVCSHLDFPGRNQDGKRRTARRDRYVRPRSWAQHGNAVGPSLLRLGRRILRGLGPRILGPRPFLHRRSGRYQTDKGEVNSNTMSPIRISGIQRRPAWISKSSGETL